MTQRRYFSEIRFKADSAFDLFIYCHFIAQLLLTYYKDDI